MLGDHKIKKPWCVTWAEIDLRAIRHNFREIKKLAGPEMEILPIVKADAYGHGMRQVALLLEKLGANFLGVSDVDEGIRLRQYGIKKDILLLESTLPYYAKQIVDYALTPTVCTIELAASLNRYAKANKKKVDIHIKVDTGMGRFGTWHEHSFEFVKQVSRFLNLSIKGIYTHFPSADTERRFTCKQIKDLSTLVRQLDRSGLCAFHIHAANSMGLAGYKTRNFNLARPGLMIYGLYPDSKLKSKIMLKPVLSVKSKIVFLKQVSKGRSISYGRTFIAKKNMIIATLPIGYNDGYLRCLSNKAFVLVDGKRCPVVGRVTMDQIMVDVSKVKSTKLGMEVIILGKNKQSHVTADDLAREAKTINYEIVCSLGNRLPRFYKE